MAKGATSPANTNAVVVFQNKCFRALLSITADLR